MSLMRDPGSVRAGDPGGRIKGVRRARTGCPACAAARLGLEAVAPVLARPNFRVLALLAFGHMVVDMHQGRMAPLLPVLQGEVRALLHGGGHDPARGQPDVLGHPARVRIPGGPDVPALAAPGRARPRLGRARAVRTGAVVRRAARPGRCLRPRHRRPCRPQGYRTAHQVAGDRKATGLSFFSIGGNIGIALGPPVITGLVTAYTLRGTLGMLGPGLLAALLIAAVLPSLVPAAPGPAAGARAATPTGTCRGRWPCSWGW